MANRYKIDVQSRREIEKHFLLTSWCERARPFVVYKETPRWFGLRSEWDFLASFETEEEAHTFVRSVTGLPVYRP